ncbi:MAG: hypothetical protein ABI197_09690 [Granulicella sp.]
MDTLLNDIFHAQPYALLIIAGLAFIGIAIVGSVKTYFDPGKAGRIAAGGIGAILVIVGVFMYKPALGPPSTSAEQAVTQSTNAQSTSAPGQSTASAGQNTTSACYAPKKWPEDLHKQMTVGEACTDNTGEPGRAVLASAACAYTSGPLAGTSQQLNHLMYIGYNCVSPDRKSKGSVLPLAAPHS